jgi:ParB/RepB/Spo0J family partition protein
MKKTAAENANGGDGFDATKPWAGMVPMESVVRNPEQPRTEFPASEIAALAVSMKAGQAQPCTVIPFTDVKRPQVRWMLVDGECRWRAAQKNGMEELYVCYRPGVTQENLHRVSFASNFCRLSHTKEEAARAIEKEHKAGLTYEEIGAMVGKTAPWALQTHQLLKLHPQLLKYMDEADPATGRKLSLRVALLMVNQDKEKQLATYLKVRSKSSGEQYHKVRQTAVVGSNRKPSDDFLYVVGLLSGSLGKLQTLSNVGEVMLRRFDAEKVAELRVWLEKIEQAAAKFRTERLARVECQVWPLLMLTPVLGWSEARTDEALRWLALGVGIFCAFVFLMGFVEWLLMGVAQRLSAARYDRRLEELGGGSEPAPVLLTKEDMEMLLVNAGLMATRKLQEDGCGMVSASVLGWSWNVTPVQMSVFLAWCRGREVETPDGRRWTAFVKVDAERRPAQAWIVLKPVSGERCDGATVERCVVPAGHTVAVHREAFEEALDRASAMNGIACVMNGMPRPLREDLAKLLTASEPKSRIKAKHPVPGDDGEFLTEGGSRS